MSSEPKYFKSKADKIAHMQALVDESRQGGISKKAKSEILKTAQNLASKKHQVLLAHPAERQDPRPRNGQE